MILADAQRARRLTGWPTLHRRHKLGLHAATLLSLQDLEPLPQVREYSDQDVDKLVYHVLEWEQTNRVPQGKAQAAGAPPAEPEDLAQRLRVAVNDVRTSKEELAVPEVTEVVTLVLVGSIGMGKTTLVNQLAKTTFPTRFGGRATKVARLVTTNWHSDDGTTTFKLRILDTPGINDGQLKDGQTRMDIQQQLTELADIDAVCLLLNAENPILEASMLDALCEYRDIFGDAFRNNWIIIMSRFKQSPQAVEDRAPTFCKDVEASIMGLLVEHRLGCTPAKFFYVDSLPRPAQDDLTHRAIDNMLDWICSNLQRIQTQDFKALSDVEQAHRRHMAVVGPMLDTTFGAKSDVHEGEPVVVLECTEYRPWRTAATLGIPGSFYSATTVRLHDLTPPQRQRLNGRQRTLRDLLLRDLPGRRIYRCERTELPRTSENRRHTDPVVFDLYFRDFN